MKEKLRVEVTIYGEETHEVYGSDDADLGTELIKKEGFFTAALEIAGMSARAEALRKLR